MARAAAARREPRQHIWTSKEGDNDALLGKCPFLLKTSSYAPFSASIKRLYNTLITEISFVLNAKDFQLTDFSEKASFESYSIFCAFYNMASILLC